MKATYLLAVLVLVSLLAGSSKAMADSCIGKKNPEKAYLREVRIAVAGEGKILQIQKTIEDFHNPEYDVTLAGGNVVHVTCDDSGDDQCGCEVAAVK